MDFEYECIHHQEKLPIKIFFHSIKECSYHWHADMEFLFVLKGSMFVQVEGRSRHLQKGDVFLVHGDEMHLTHETDTKNLILTLQIDPSLAEKYDPDFRRLRFDLEPSPGKRDDANLREVRRILAQLMWEMRIKKAGYQFQAESLIHSLLMLLLRKFDHTLTPPDLVQRLADERAAYYCRLERIVKYVDANYRERISLHEVAHGEKLNLTYLSRFFKKKMGCTFMKFVQHTRLRKSLAELRDTDGKIVDIALDYGFANVKSYHAAFKQMYGTTPSAWREACRKETSETAGKDCRSYVDYDAGDAMEMIRKYVHAT